MVLRFATRTLFYIVVALGVACDANLDAGYNHDRVTPIGADAGMDAPLQSRNFTVEGQPILLQKNGSARAVGEAIVLTEDLESQQGTAFIPTPFALAPRRNFTIDMIFQIEYGTIAADGIALVWHADLMGAFALGGAGGGISIGELNPSLAVVFDTHNGNGNEPAPGIMIGHGGDFSSTPLVVRDPPFDLADGRRVYAWLTYRGGVMDVFVADVNTKPAEPWISTPVDLTAEVGAEAFLGVAAATGAKFARHTLHALHVKTGI
jgi:Legume lectin domain